MDQVVYIELFLLKRVLKWFKLYFIDIQIYKDQTINLETKYMFLSWTGFLSRLIQIFRDLKAITIVEQKLQNITLQMLVIKYIIQFQTLLVQVKWNNKALMVQYNQGLKAKVQNAIILTLGKYGTLPIASMVSG